MVTSAHIPLQHAKVLCPSRTTSDVRPDSAFSATRPSSPVVMDSSVVDYDAPFDEGQQEIPVFGVQVLPASGEGVLTITESELRASGSSYDFRFDPTSFVMFPTVLTEEIDLIESKQELMARVHLAGLPHSAQANGVGTPASTVLEITPLATEAPASRVRR